MLILLNSDGKYDDTFERASDSMYDDRKSVRFNDRKDFQNYSAINKPSDKPKNQYQSPFKLASKMITSNY